jgi:hypothetical protein
MARQESNIHIARPPNPPAYDADRKDGESVGDWDDPVYENITHSFPAGKTHASLHSMSGIYYSDHTPT